MNKIDLSLVIPVYNEEEALKKTVTGAAKFLKKSPVKNFEIIVVNDGSTDQTRTILRKIKSRYPYLKIINHRANCGYGRAIKSGIKKAKYQWLMIIDADGTYPVEAIPDLIEKLPNFGMVVGSRKKRPKIPLIRIVPKKILLWLANFLTGEKIADINSGLRVFPLQMAQEFWHLFPERFSFTTTLTLSAHFKRYPVIYLPIEYRRRIGRSSIKPNDFLYFAALIVRLITYFNPLKFFFWPGVSFISFGIITIFYTLISYRNLTDVGLLLIISGIQVSFFGLIADLIVKNRESHEKKP